MKNIEINVTGETKELIIREGTALPPVQPKAISEIGSIESPSKFHAIRNGLPNKSIVVYSRNDKKIVFQADPENPLAATITGKLLLNKDLEKFNINAEKNWEVKELAKFFKMNKFFFDNKEINAKIVTALNNFKASVSTAMEQNQDNRGNMKDLIEKVVKSNVPEKFNLQMPIFIGYKEMKFPVEICFDTTDAGATCWLESPELNQLIISERDRIIDEEIAKFKGLIIIEQ